MDGSFDPNVNFKERPVGVKSFRPKNMWVCITSYTGAENEATDKANAQEALNKMRLWNITSGSDSFGDSYLWWKGYHTNGGIDPVGVAKMDVPGSSGGVYFEEGDDTAVAVSASSPADDASATVTAVTGMENLSWFGIEGDASGVPGWLAVTGDSTIDLGSEASPNTADCAIGDLEFEFDDNTTDDYRVSHVHFMVKQSNADAPDTAWMRNHSITFLQSPAAAATNTGKYLSDTNLFVLSSSESTGETFTVTASEEAGDAPTWTVVANDSWITITSPTSAQDTGDTDVTFNVTANETDASRTGTISIVANSNIVNTITIYQQTFYETARLEVEYDTAIVTLRPNRGDGSTFDWNNSGDLRIVPLVFYNGEPVDYTDIIRIGKNNGSSVYTYGTGVQDGDIEYNEIVVDNSSENYGSSDADAGDWTVRFVSNVLTPISSLNVGGAELPLTI